MEMNTDPKWLKEMAAREDGCFVSVGGLVTTLEDAETEAQLNGKLEATLAALQSALDECPTCFGKGAIERRPVKASQQAPQPHPNREGHLLESCETCKPYRAVLNAAKS